VFKQNVSYGKTGNTGMGFFIVEQTIRRYGGTIEIVDNHPAGTCFNTALPTRIFRN